MLPAMKHKILFAWKNKKVSRETLKENPQHERDRKCSNIGR